MGRKTRIVFFVITWSLALPALYFSIVCPLPIFQNKRVLLIDVCMSFQDRVYNSNTIFTSDYTIGKLEPMLSSLYPRNLIVGESKRVANYQVIFLD